MNFKLLIIVAISTFFIGCVDKTTNETKIEEQTKTEIAIKKSKEALSAISSAVSSKVDEAKEVMAEKAPELTKTIETTTTKVTKVVKQKVAEVSKIVNDKMKNANTLYKPCAGCHGASAEKKALGKSAVIKGWNEDKILTSLIGYKNETYGGSMKAVMSSQIKSLSDTDLKILSKHISEF